MLASRSLRPPYKCLQPWPEGSSAQCGGCGISQQDQRTLFSSYFLVYLHDPMDTFIRTDAGTIEEAESRAFQQYQRSLDCKGHEYIHGPYTDGSGVCKHCGLYQSDVLEPLTTCDTCGDHTAWRLIDDKWFCQKHDPLSTQK